MLGKLGPDNLGMDIPPREQLEATELDPAWARQMTDDEEDGANTYPAKVYPWDAQRRSSVNQVHRLDNSIVS